MSQIIHLEYFDKNIHSEDEYIEMLQQYYGARAYHRYQKRGEWYESKGGYRRLIAFNGDTMVGQSTSFRDTAVVHGLETELWWSCDSFVLPEFRGKGLGKMLQGELHKNLLNFSSAWYSPANGHIKRKLGAKELFYFSFTYYPVSSLLSLFVNKLRKKKIGWLRPIPLLPQIYILLNNSKITPFQTEEVTLTEDIVPFIQNVLAKHDFYIRRDWNYLKWRYDQNPDLRYHIIKISLNDNVVAYQFVSDVITEKGHKYVYSLDTFIENEALISYKQVLLIIASYWKKKGVNIDGVWSIQQAKWIGKFSWSKRPTALLSTLNTERITNPYLSYSDQDMVQM